MDRSHIVQVPAWFRTVRFVQIGLAVLILLLNAIGIGLWADGGIGYGIFTSVATVIICTYYLVSTGSRPNLFNWVAVVVLEAFMELWWLSAFSVAAWVASAFAIINSYDDNIYADSALGSGWSARWHGAYICFAISAAASAIEWVLITTTLITFIIGITRHNKSARNNATYASNPMKMEEGIGHAPQGQVPVYVQPNGQYVAA